jgi:hypothetical protein
MVVVMVMVIVMVMVARSLLMHVVVESVRGRVLRTRLASSPLSSKSTCSFVAPFPEHAKRMHHDLGIRTGSSLFFLLPSFLSSHAALSPFLLFRIVVGGDGDGDVGCDDGRRRVRSSRLEICDTLLSNCNNFLALDIFTSLLSPSLPYPSTMKPTGREQKQ